MHKNSYTLVGFLVVLLLSAPSCWAHRVIRPAIRPSHAAIARRIGLKITSPTLTTAAKVPAAARSITPTQELAAKIEHQVALRQLHAKNMATIQAVKTAHATKEKFNADHTVLGATNTTSQTGTILFRSVPVGELKPREYILALSAFDSNGRLVISLEETANAKKPITIENLEQGIPGYDIARVIIAIRSRSTDAAGKSVIRIIDYNVFTQTVAKGN